MTISAGGMAIINLSYLKENLNTIANSIGGLEAIIAFIGGNAYGHGSQEVGRALERFGVTKLAVHTTEEAAILRTGGLTVPIIILGYGAPGPLVELAELNAEIGIIDSVMVNYVSQSWELPERTLRFHIRLSVSDVGGLGFAGITRLLRQGPSREWFQGMYIESRDAAEVSEFRRYIRSLKRMRIEPPDRYVIGMMPEHADAEVNRMIIGEALFGLSDEDGSSPLELSLRPVMSVKTQIVQVATSRSVNTSSEAHGEPRLGLIPLGVSSGLPRQAREHAAVLVRGKSAPIVEVLLTEATIDLSSVPEARPGDEVVIIGRQDNAENTFRNLTERIGWPEIEMAMKFGDRLKRYYVEES